MRFFHPRAGISSIEKSALANLAVAGIERPKAADGTTVPITNTADTGYFSEKAIEELEKLGMDPHVATGRQKNNEIPEPAVKGEAASTASAKEKMRHKLRTAAGKLLYVARKQIVEPVFGQLESAREIREFLRRGLEKVSAEWQLICLTHNLPKIWRRTCRSAAS